MHMSLIQEHIADPVRISQAGAIGELAEHLPLKTRTALTPLQVSWPPSGAS